MRATTSSLLASLLLCAAPAVLASPPPPMPTNLGELAECRQAVERVLWERSLWPEENPGAKPEFDALVSLEDIALRMQDVLLRADALGKRWHQPVDQAALEQELRRMRRTSQDRELLAALIEAAGSRPRAALCVVMPDLVLSEFHAAYANDLNIHGARRVEIERRLEKGLAYPAALGPDVAVHSERFERNPTAHQDAADGLPAAAWQSVLARFDIPPDEPSAGSDVGKAARADLGNYIGARTGLIERHGDFALQEITAADDDSLTIRTMVWAKQPLHAWWSRARAGFDAHIPRFESKANTVVENTSVLPDPLLPGARYGQAAAWTGTEMIIWGGHDGVAPVADGYRYTPATNSWVPLVDFNSPTARWLPSVVWTGLDVIIWGGASTTGGGVTPSDHRRYRPTADQWDTLAAAPISSRYHHVAVWTGSRMIIWGGIENGFGVASSGALYNPADNSWEAMTAPSPPSARFRAVAVWTGNEMVVWGGEAGGGVHLGDGARFTPGAPGSWTAVAASGAPSPRSLHTAVWTGPPLNRMLVWGGKFASASALADGALYDPSGNAWTTMAAGGPAARYFQTAVWTGSEMIVWGGTSNNSEWLSSGARYAPESNTWTSPTTLVDAPTGRYIHTAVWSGDRMIVWGGRGEGGKPFHTGGRYSVAGNTWSGTGAYTSCETVFGNLVPNCGAEQGSPPEGWAFDMWGSGRARDSITYRAGQHSVVMNSGLNVSEPPRQAATIRSGCFAIQPDVSLDIGAHVLVRSAGPVTCTLGTWLSPNTDCSSANSAPLAAVSTSQRWQRISAKVRPDSSRIAARLRIFCVADSDATPAFTLNVDDAYAVLTPPQIFRDGFEAD
jgi:N-acetylneuraminic acid mutarotase